MANNKPPAAGKPRSKTELFQELATTTGLNRKQVAAVFEQLTELIKKDLGKKGPGVFTIPGLLKILRVTKPATKERTGINRFTGLEQVFKAKPARTVPKVRALKSLKDMVK